MRNEETSTWAILSTIGLSAAASMWSSPAVASPTASGQLQDTIAETFGQCGAEGQRACTILERSDPCDAGLKMTSPIFGKCVSDEEAEQEPAPEPERQFRPVRADSIRDVDLLRFANAAYQLPHHKDLNFRSGRAPAMIGCNRGDRLEACASQGVWTNDQLDDQYGQLEYVFTARNGMQAGLYHYKNTDQFVLAFAGTDPKRPADLIEDVRLALAIPVDWRIYETLSKQVDARMKALNPEARTDRHLTVTGHSLGGFQAQVFAAFSKVALFTTFSSPSAIGSITTSMKIPATSYTRGKHLYREGDPVAETVIEQYGPRVKYTATPYELGPINLVTWRFEQHNKEKFLALLEAGARPYGHVNFRGEKLRSKKIGSWPVRARHCVTGNLNPFNESFNVGLCTSGVTFNFDRNGMFRNRRVNDAFETCMEAGARGARVFMAQCNGSPSQIWRHRGSQFRNVMTGKCLDWSQNNASQLITWDCNGAINQQWEFYKPTLTRP